MNQGKWIRKAKKSFNIVFIHGINSGEDCWKHKNGSYWPSLLKDESELADIGIYVFSYRTGINTGFYSLSDIVDSLREYFRLDDLISSVGVIFVCHSMGGIVTRRFLVNQHSTLIEKGLNKIGLFLVASPSLGAEYANMLGLLSSVMGHTQASALRFSQSNVWLNDLDKDFINLISKKNLQIKGKELIEDLPLYGKRLIRKQVVEPFSGAKYFGNSFKVPGSDHSTIAAPADKDAVQHRLLVQFIKKFIEEESSSPGFSDDSITTQSVDNSDPFQRQQQVISNYDNAMFVSYAWGSESERITDNESPKLLQALADSDPLVCLPAATALAGRSDLGAELLDISGNPVVSEAVRIVLGSVPEKSAELIINAIKNCGVTGETWYRARRASEYCITAHRPFAEKAIMDLLLRSDVEIQRHALTALGRMGCLAFYTSEVDQVLGRPDFSFDDSYQKCFGYALTGAAYNFVIAEDDLSIRIASELLLHLMNIGEKTKTPMVFPYALPLGKCAIRHIDEILTTWLETDNPYVKTLGLCVLGRLRAARSAKKIIEVFRNHRDDDIGKTAATALWSIGEPSSLRTLLNLGVEVDPEGLLSLDGDAFDHWFPRVLDSNSAWFAYRALGLRGRKDKTALLQDGLFHTNPTVRGSAALALARLGEQNGLKKAYDECDNIDERIFITLAVLTANLIDYGTLEQQLRIDLSKSSYIYAIEAQEDILTCLRGCRVAQADALAKAWAPFYGRGDIDVNVNFSLG